MATSSMSRPCLTRWVSQGTHKASWAIAASTTSAGRAIPFSTTVALCKRRRATTKDNNKARGVSSLYRSGPREPLSMSSIPLPKPRHDFKPEVKLDKDHGLWGFFPEPGKLMWTPTEVEEHGRGWTVEELRRKSWEDLHALWWTCCKERNRLATAEAELRRSQIGFGEREMEVRDEEVKQTMQSIRHVLTERYYTWEDAVKVAESDPEVNMDAGEGEAYIPSAYEDDVGGTEFQTSSVDASEQGGHNLADEPSKVEAKLEKQAV